MTRRGVGMVMLALTTVVAPAAIQAMAPPVLAAIPSHGSLSTTPSSLAWQGGPLSGTAPVQRQLCPPVSCDDFALDLAPPRGDTMLTITVTASGSNTVAIALFPPGCGTGTTPQCYTGFGPDTGLTQVSAAVFRPSAGRYVIRVACGSCLDAGYTAIAELAAPPIPPTSRGAIRRGAADTGPPVSFATRALTPPPNAGITMAEPGISINGAGRAVVNTFGPTVWLSGDAGRSWSAPNASIDPTGCGSQGGVTTDADAAVASDGTLYVVGLCQAALTNFFFRSTDGGQTWNSSRFTLPVPAGADADRPWIAVDPTNAQTVYLSYHSAGAVAKSDYTIYVLKSTDGGQTFLPASSPTGQYPAGEVDNTLGGNVVDRILVDPSDPRRLYLVWATTSAVQGTASSAPNGDPGFSQIRMGTSRDGGLTWSLSDVFDAGAGTIAHVWPVSAIDAAGDLYVAFSHRLAGATETHLKLISSLDHGQTWSLPAQVDTGGLRSNVFPALAAAGPGQVDLVWEGSRAGDYDDTGAAWSIMFAQGRDVLDTPAFEVSPIASINHAGGICMAGAVGCETLNLNPTLYDFLSVTVDRQGMAQAAWTDDVHGPSPVIMTARQVTGPATAAVEGGSPRVQSSLPNTAAAGAGADGRPWHGHDLQAALIAAVGMLAIGLGRRRGRRIQGDINARPVRRSTYNRGRD